MKNFPSRSTFGILSMNYICLCVVVAFVLFNHLSRKKNTLKPAWMEYLTSSQPVFHGDFNAESHSVGSNVRGFSKVTNNTSITWITSLNKSSTHPDYYWRGVPFLLHLHYLRATSFYFLQVNLSIRTRKLLEENYDFFMVLMRCSWATEVLLQ